MPVILKILRVFMLMTDVATKLWIRADQPEEWRHSALLERRMKVYKDPKLKP